jgi:hypothetical protein
MVGVLLSNLSMPPNAPSSAPRLMGRTGCNRAPLHRSLICPVGHQKQGKLTSLFRHPEMSPYAIKRPSCTSAPHPHWRSFVSIRRCSSPPRTHHIDHHKQPIPTPPE